MGDSPTGNQYTNGEMESLAADDDFCEYGEDGFYTTCIKDEHIDQGRDCATIMDVELGCRIADLTETLDLVLHQLAAKTRHLDPDAPRLRYRFIRQHLSTARDEVHNAHRAYHHKEQSR